MIFKSFTVQYGTMSCIIVFSTPFKFGEDRLEFCYEKILSFFSENISFASYNLEKAPNYKTKIILVATSSMASARIFVMDNKLAKRRLTTS